MGNETKTALCEWLSGLIIGLMPLTAHLLLHFFAKTDPAWDDNWSADILFITISNSGLSAVTVFSRVIRGSFSLSTLTSTLGVLMAFTIVFFFCGGLLYGATASGKSNHYTIIAAYFLLIFSCLCSMYFELSLARRIARTNPERAG